MAQSLVAKKLENSLVGAALVGDAKRVERLLRRGASPNSVSDGTTAVYAGAMRHDGTIVQLLLEAGADPNVESDARRRDAALWRRVLGLLLCH